jgi:WD40 repeat protein
MDRDSLRRYAQITLGAIAALSAIGAGYRYLVRGGSPFGQHLVVTPASGPIGMRPFVEFPGYKEGQEVSVYLCAGSTGGVEDCANLGKGKAGSRLRAKPIPKELPDTTEVLPGEYVLRAGPDAQGEYPQRGGFDVVAFKVGSRPRPPAFDVPPSSLVVGKPRRVATGAPCRPPLFLADGRLAVGSTVVDPTTGVQIEFDLPAQELAWSPVGDKLAILTSDRKEIRLAAPDGSGATAKVREARGFVSSLSWSPSGDRLAYIAQPDPATRQLFGDPTSPTVKILNVASGESTSAGPGLAVAWSPSKNLLAVEMAGAKIQASTPQGGRRDLTSGRRPAWSPDGRYLTVVRTAPSGTSQGWVVPVRGAGAAPLGGSNVCALSFSPAGTSLAVVADNEGKTTLMLRSIEKRAAG